MRMREGGGRYVYVGGSPASQTRAVLVGAGLHDVCALLHWTLWYRTARCSPQQSIRCQIPIKLLNMRKKRGMRGSVLEREEEEGNWGGGEVI